MNEPAPEVGPAPTPQVDPDKLRIKVRDRDIALCAFGKCPRCWGSGFTTWSRQLYAKKGSPKYPGVEKSPTYTKDTKLPITNPVPRRVKTYNTRSEKPLFVRRDPLETEKEICPCAVKRFTRLQATDLDPATGELYYAGTVIHITDETKKEHDAFVAALKAGAPVIVRKTQEGKTP